MLVQLGKWSGGYGASGGAQTHIILQATSDNQTDFTLPQSGLQIDEMRVGNGALLLNGVHYTVSGSTLTLSGYSVASGEYITGYGK